MNGPTVEVGGSTMPTIWYFKIIDINNLKCHRKSNAELYK